MTMKPNIFFEAAITPSGEINQTAPFNKGRVKIFYAGDNRNQVHIASDVATELMNTLAYVPIVGIYNEDAGDFESHAKTEEDAKRMRMYGVVPADNNAVLEEVVENGIKKFYWSSDVYIWNRYPESASIFDKQQSMELNEYTLEGT